MATIRYMLFPKKWGKRVYSWEKQGKNYGFENVMKNSMI